MKKYVVMMHSYKLEIDCIKAVCSTKEKAFEMILTIFNTLIGWLPEEATDIEYSFRNGGWRRFVSFNPKKDTSIDCFKSLKNVNVEIDCVEFEEDSLPSWTLDKECFFEEV